MTCFSAPGGMLPVDGFRLSLYRISISHSGREPAVELIASRSPSKKQVGDCLVITQQGWG